MCLPKCLSAAESFKLFTLEKADLFVSYIKNMSQNSNLFAKMSTIPFHPKAIGVTVTLKKYPIATQDVKNRRKNTIQCYLHTVFTILSALQLPANLTPLSLDKLPVFTLVVTLSAQTCYLHLSRHRVSDIVLYINGLFQLNKTQSKMIAKK